MGRDKAFVRLGGRPLVAHVVERLSPQVAALAISANVDLDRFAEFGLDVLTDESDVAGGGPLAGVLAGLSFATRRGFEAIATVPVDAPFLPREFVSTLTKNAKIEAPVVAECEGRQEPLFAIWPTSAGAAVRAALLGGDLAVHKILAKLGGRAAPFPPSDPYPFLNINAPSDLAAAERRLAQR